MQAYLEAQASTIFMGNLVGSQPKNQIMVMMVNSKRIKPPVFTVRQLSEKYGGAQALTIRLVKLLGKILKTERLQNQHNVDLILEFLEKLHSLSPLE